MTEKRIDCDLCGTTHWEYPSDYEHDVFFRVQATTVALTEEEWRRHTGAPPERHPHRMTRYGMDVLMGAVDFDGVDG